MRIYLTRNCIETGGLIYLWTIPGEFSIYADVSGAWDTKEDEDYRSVIGTAEQFENLTGRKAPEEGSIVEISQMNLVGY